MATLNGTNINATYQGLVKSLDNNEITTKTKLTDGNGNQLSLSLAPDGAGADLNGPLNVTNGAVTIGTNSVPSPLTVEGITTLNSELITNGNLRADSNLMVKGNLSANSFNFTGDGIFRGTTTMYQTLSVSAATTVNGALSVGNGDVTFTGDLSVNGDIVAFATSDKRLKDEIKPLDSKIYFDKLDAYEYVWNKNSTKHGQKGKGFIAQEVKAVDESLVHENEWLRLDYQSFIPILFAEIKRLNKEVEILKKSINNTAPVKKTKKKLS